MMLKTSIACVWGFGARCRNIPSESMRSSSFPITCIRSGGYPRMIWIFPEVAIDQALCRIRYFGRHQSTWRETGLATALLGASDPRRRGLETACRLHPLQSGETWLCEPSERLAVEFVCKGIEAGLVFGGLGGSRSLGIWMVWISSEMFGRNAALVPPYPVSSSRDCHSCVVS